MPEFAVGKCPTAQAACGVRINVRGKLHTLVYDRLVARTVEPVEKKPLFHCLLGSTACSIATVGRQRRGGLLALCEAKKQGRNRVVAPD